MYIYSIDFIFSNYFIVVKHCPKKPQKTVNLTKCGKPEK